jgi:hypothetical protein
MNGPGTRPMGITILALLALIGGVFSLIAGLAVMAGGAILGGAVGGTTGAAYGGFAFILGLIVLAGAVFYLAFAYGAWTLKSWGWALGVIGALWGIVVNVLTAVMSGDIVNGLIAAIIPLAIGVGILYYLNQPHVKAAFGRV